MGGALLVAGGAIQAYFGAAWLAFGHALGAASVLVGATAVAVFGAVVYSTSYPRDREQKKRLVAKVIPLVLFTRVGDGISRPLAKRTPPRVIPLGPGGGSPAPYRAVPINISRVPPRIAMARGSAAPASVRHR
jgi:hypothetical protein